MRQMHGSVCVDLPADEFEEASAKLKFKPLWETFVSGAKAAGLVTSTKLETLETKAKPVTAGAKRGRKTRTPFAEIVTQADQRVMDAVKRASAEELPKDAA